MAPPSSALPATSLLLLLLLPLLLLLLLLLLLTTGALAQAQSHSHMRRGSVEDDKQTHRNLDSKVSGWRRC